ncbi:nitrilase-related carbon-nitrogen hydrolase [Alteribacillus sp. JSM 102045]|uniref:nitrilase-related carbon-nitrogen hydrolase n=1 Tax=Alteribacillus sp. JSM 102045 TaxID=1562101 RepID=UPI0035C06734
MVKVRNCWIIIFSVMLFIVTGCQGEETQTAAKEEPEDQEDSFTAATIQFNPKLNEKEENVDELYEAAEEAFKNGAKVAVAPEMATTGYMYDSRSEIEPFVESIPGDTTDKFSDLTEKYDSYIVFGMPEVDEETDLYYNSAVFIGPDGYIGKYRKTQMWETEMHWAAWGDMGIPVFDTDIGKIAINICMDSAYFEPARLAGIKGADILAFPTNSSAQTISALPARAQQNGMHVISANRSNTEEGFHMIGGSAIWSAAGEKLAEAPIAMDEEEAIEETKIEYAEIDPKEYENENKKRLENRRPELYKELSHYIHPWDETKSTESQDIDAAALQYEPIIGDKEKNKKKISKLVGQAASEDDIDLIVLPEMSLTGPVDEKQNYNLRKIAEKEQGETQEYMASLAEKYNTAIVYGFLEKEKGSLYNGAVLLDEKGEQAGKYRKTHLSEEEQDWVEEGGELPVFETDNLGKIGILIGEDALFPEASGVMAVNRADIIAIPSSWHGQYGGEMEINRELAEHTYPKHAMVTWDSVAIGAQAYTVVGNFVGTEKEYQGGSGVYGIDPLYGLDKVEIASKDKEEVQMASFKTVPQDWWFNQEKLLASRQPEYYTPLIEH